MNPLYNPFSPGAGRPPPELAGRQDITDRALLALERIKRGRSEKSMMLVGLRGVGKTVLLNRISNIAEEHGYKVAMIEAHENKDLATLLYPNIRSPITRDVVNHATQVSISRLDESFFRVRFDRLTPREKQYLRALAELGPETQRSGDVAEKIGIAPNKLAPVRNSLTKKGMIYSPAYGDTAFTVPLFDEFMKRTMP